MTRSWRINLIFGLLIVFSATIIGRLIFLQVIKGEYYRAMAQGQQKSFSEMEGDRGKIFLQDRSGNLDSMAINNSSSFVYAVPQEIQDKNVTAETLSTTLNLGKDEVLNKIENKDSFYVILKNKLSDEEVNSLKSLNLPGIELDEKATRYYPKEEMACHVIGFLGGDNIGQYGIEGFYDDVLRGKAEFVARERGPLGFSVSDPEKFLSKNGSDIILSIDNNIQFFSENLLKSAKEEFNIESGQIIVMDPLSGKILAIAGIPSFNPNYYSKESDLSIFQNDAIQEAFEPGSSFKPFTMAAALDKGALTADTTYVDDGNLRIGGYPITNYDRKIWGERTMHEVLEKSINTGAVFAERQVGNAFFLEYLKRFGFFQKTGIDLQGEVVSGNKEFNEGRDINFATAAFGQGIEITPIQLVSAFSAFANGGKLIKPSVVDKIINWDGKEKEMVPDEGTDNVEQIISQNTASQITSMLVNVVEKGTAKRAKIPGYYIAGKTGTAQVAYPSLGIQRSGYSEQTIQTFVGFAPAFNPQFIALVKLNNPNVRTAEISAVPIFKDLAKYIIDYWQIPPDYE